MQFVLSCRASKMIFTQETNQISHNFQKKKKRWGDFNFMPNFHSNFQNFLARGFSGSRLFPTHDSEFITGLDFCYVFLIRLMFFKNKVYRQYYRLVSHPNVHCRTNNQKCSCECEHVQVHFWLFCSVQCIGLVPNICLFQF